MTEPTVAVPKAEYDELIKCQAHLHLILETSNKDGYVNSETVNAVKRILGYPTAVRTDCAGSSDVS